MFFDQTSYEERLSDLTALFERSFKRQLQASFLKWRYLDNTTGQLLVCAEFDQDRLIANYSASPVVMNVHGETVKAAMSMTTMTDPDYAGRGLFPKLANELYQHMSDEGYAMIWGFPNRNSHRGFVTKLGWSDVYEIPTMQLTLTDVVSEGLPLETDDQFEMDYQEQTPLADGIYVVKNQRYLKWRYAANPGNEYTNLVLQQGGVVSSFAVIKRFENTLDLVDFQAQNPEEGKQLLKRVIQWAGERNLVAINCWAPRHHFMHTLCEQFGFINKEPITYLGVRQLSEVSSGNKISTNYSDWFLQMGDSDVY